MARKNRSLAAKHDRAKRERREAAFQSSLREVEHRAMVKAATKARASAEPTRIIYTHW